MNAMSSAGDGGAAFGRSLVQAKRARRLIARWAERIRALARDEAEPAWADKAELLAANVAKTARLVARRSAAPARDSVEGA